jgi:hypothetical protein
MMGEVENKSDGIVAIKFGIYKFFGCPNVQSLG